MRHDRDLLDLRNQLREDRFFFVRRLQMIQRFALLLGEHFQNVPRRHAAEGVKAFLGEKKLILFGHLFPGAPVQGHAVGQRAVAVKYKGFNGLQKGFSRLKVYGGEAFFHVVRHQGFDHAVNVAFQKN